MDLLLPALLLVTLPLLVGCGEDAVPEPPYCPGPSTEIPWGETVDGLALAVEVPETRYVEGEEMRFAVRVRNVSRGPLKLSSFDDHMWFYGLRFENLGDGPDFVGTPLELVDFVEPPDLTLGPGDAWTKDVNLTKDGRILRVIPDRKPGDDWDYRDHLPPGRWRVTLAWNGGLKGRDGFWTGRVESRAVAVTVTAAP